MASNHGRHDVLTCERDMKLLEARRQLGRALEEWRDAGGSIEQVVFAVEDLAQLEKRTEFKWWPAILRHVIFYIFDMGIAIAGWTWGFGLHVTNWWALVGLLVFSRFVFHTLSSAWIRADALNSAEGKEANNG